MPNVDAIICRQGKRLTVHAYRQNPWREGTAVGRISWKGAKYDQIDGYPGEWLAVTRSQESLEAIGFVLDLPSMPDLVAWLKTGLRNVTFEDIDRVRVLFENCSSPVVPGWPFVPPAVFRDKRGELLIYLVEYYSGEPTAGGNAG